MSFEEVAQRPLLQGSLPRGIVTVLGKQGLRLTGLGSFHLDEGPNFVWLNIYRTLADGTELEITREREPNSVELKDGAAEVRWSPCEAVDAETFARYRIVESDSAVDVTFGAKVNRDYSNFELFIANYFTPFYFPSYAITDNQTHPEDIYWYTKRLFGEDENESWARDAAAESVFRDGRWLTGHALNWRRGPFFKYPLMIQEHRYGHAIILMARPKDCFGLSGYNSYHNSQYFHLFGRDVAAGDQVETTVRMVLLTKWEDLKAEAVALYKSWV
ncbi:MAG: hypothetical protein O3B01_08585 [Planctomycetota bacterium]|nr:hypothetical protein [Planctomycetota bacterium]